MSQAYEREMQKMRDDIEMMQNGNLTIEERIQAMGWIMARQHNLDEVYENKLMPERVSELEDFARRFESVLAETKGHLS